ncbi:MAG: hypothetical protein LUQ01_02170 [Methanolinea sp.]|nr:hypothetical protein [Methanolinea sp.]
MKDSTRRTAIFAVIVVFGSVMVLLDLPVFYLLAGAIVLGILLLFLTGTIKLPSLKRKKAPGTVKAEARKPIDDKQQKKEARKKEKEARKKVPGKKGGTGTFFSSLKGAFSVLGRDLKRMGQSKTEKEQKKRKIDSMLDLSVAGAEVASLNEIIPDSAPVDKKKTSDPFSALVSSEELNPDLLTDITPEDEFGVLDDISFPGEGDTQANPPSSEDVAGMDIGLSGDEIPIALDETNDADEVKEILEAHKDDMGDAGGDQGMGDFTGDGLEGLEDIDLDGVDVGEGAEESKRKGAATAAGPPPPASSASPPSGSPASKAGGKASAASAVSEAQEMVSFGSGKREDDDLMASLKAEAKGVKKSENASLLRDMKDVHVLASDLEKDLKDLLKGGKEKPD